MRLNVKLYMLLQARIISILRAKNMRSVPVSLSYRRLNRRHFLETRCIFQVYIVSSLDQCHFCYFCASCVFIYWVFLDFVVSISAIDMTDSSPIRCIICRREC